MSNQIINEVGNRYGALEVVCYCKNKDNRGAWLCQCDCGWLKVVRGPDLRKGKITSCGCRINSREKRINDLTGRTYGKLTVIKRADEYYNKINKKNVWECKCECGNICYKLGNSLQSGKTKSCGCSTQTWICKNRAKFLKGKIFGKLTVISDEWINNSFLHKCQCECGNIIYTTTIQLTSGQKQDCGCDRNSYSKGEKYIAYFLKKYKILFLQEYSFDNLKTEFNRKLRFDFAIFRNEKLIGLIEYDGGQHLKPCSLFGGEEQYKILQQHDLMKNEYCKNNNIPLLRLNEVSNFSKLDDIILNFIKNLDKIGVWND